MAGKTRTRKKAGKPPAYVEEVLRFAANNGLDLSIREAALNPWAIQVEERVDPVYVRRFARAMDDAGGWPEAMPLPVVTDGELPSVLDGSHRITAARAAGLDRIPVLLASWEAYETVTEQFGMPRFHYVHEVLPAASPGARETLAKDVEAGTSKRRTTEPWDMEAFRR